MSKTILTLDFSNAIYERQARKGGHKKISFTNCLKMKLDLSKSKGCVILPPKPYLSGEEYQDWQFGLRITYKFSPSKNLLELSIIDIDEECDGLMSMDLQMDLSSSGSGKSQGTFWLLGNEGKISNIIYKISS